jgi:hypothetical protein
MSGSFVVGLGTYIGANAGRFKRPLRTKKKGGHNIAAALVKEMCRRATF